LTSGPFMETKLARTTVFSMRIFMPNKVSGFGPAIHFTGVNDGGRMPPLPKMRDCHVGQTLRALLAPGSSPGIYDNDNQHWLGTCRFNYISTVSEN
jgi:hypothetical protein